MTGAIILKSKPKSELVFFFAGTIIVTWLLWLPVFLIENHGLHLPFPSELFLRLGGFVPSVAGFILAFALDGKMEALSIVKSILNVHIRLKWIIFTFTVLPAVSIVSCFISLLFGGSFPKLQFPVWFIPAVFLYILFLMGPLGEEAGWRGFALKRLLVRYSPIKSAVLLGIVWSFWHLPLFFINGTTQNTLSVYGYFPAFLCYLLYTVLVSILITLLYIKSNDSVFGAILFHTMGNLSLGVFPIIFTKTGAITLLLVLTFTCLGFVHRFRMNLFGLRN